MQGRLTNRSPSASPGPYVRSRRVIGLTRPGSPEGHRNSDHARDLPILRIGPCTVHARPQTSSMPENLSPCPVLESQTPKSWIGEPRRRPEVEPIKSFCQR